MDNWPKAMRVEWGDDEGLAAARAHRAVVVDAFRRLRAELDAFQPDFVLIWGDDQYENFKEDVVPPFCVYMYDQLDCLPYQASRGHQHAAERLGPAAGQGRPGPRTPRGRRLPGAAVDSQPVRRRLRLQAASSPDASARLHAHNHVLGLRPARLRLSDHSVPRQLLRQRPDEPRRSSGVRGRPTAGAARADADALLRPWAAGGPHPGRQPLAGGAGRLLVLVARFPDEEALRAVPRRGVRPPTAGGATGRRHAEWRNLDLATLVDAGQHEFLNWVCLAGAMAERRAEVLAFAETWLFNSTKVAALFRG